MADVPVTEHNQHLVVKALLDAAIDPADFTWYGESSVISEPFSKARPAGPYFSLQTLDFAAAVSSDSAANHDFPNDHIKTEIRIQAFGQEAIEALSEALFTIRDDEELDAIQEATNHTIGTENESVSRIDLMLDEASEARGYLDVWVGCVRLKERVIVATASTSIAPGPSTGNVSVPTDTLETIFEDPAP